MKLFVAAAAFISLSPPMLPERSRTRMTVAFFLVSLNTSMIDACVSALTFANGVTHTDGGWLNYKHHEYTFAYDDMVLAAARLMGPLKTHYGFDDREVEFFAIHIEADEVQCAHWLERSPALVTALAPEPSNVLSMTARLARTSGR